MLRDWKEAGNILWDCNTTAKAQMQSVVGYQTSLIHTYSTQFTLFYTSKAPLNLPKSLFLQTCLGVVRKHQVDHWQQNTKQTVSKANLHQ